MNRIQLSLNANEVNQLAGVLGITLAKTDLSKLKKDMDHDYLFLACVHDFYNKLDGKRKEIAAFGTKPNQLFRISLKRHEALAFFFLVRADQPEVKTLLPVMQPHTANLISNIVGQIHLYFFV